MLPTDMVLIEDPKFKEWVQVGVRVRVGVRGSVRVQVQGAPGTRGRASQHARSRCSERPLQRAPPTGRSQPHALHTLPRCLASCLLSRCLRLGAPSERRAGCWLRAPCGLLALSTARSASVLAPQIYAKSEDKFFADFAVAFQKLTELGFKQ